MLKKQKSMLLVLVMGMLAACGQNTPTPTLSYDPVSYGPVGSENLTTQEDLQAVVKSQMGAMVVDFQAAGRSVLTGSAVQNVQQVLQQGIGQQQLQRFGMQNMAQVSQLTQQANCEPTRKGDLTDADQDKIEVNMTLDLVCVQSGDGGTLTSKVAGWAKDKDDHDPVGGFSAEVVAQDDLQANGNLLGERIARRAEDTKNGPDQHTFVSSLRYDLLAKGKNNQGKDIDLKLVDVFNQTLLAQKTEGAVNLTVNGVLSEFVKLNGSSAAGKITYTGTLHFVNTDVCKGIDGGEVTFQSGPFSSKLVFSNCNVVSQQ